MDADLLSFLCSQKLMVIASCDNGPWVCNVFYGVDDSGIFYFVSSSEAKHSKQILNNPEIAFSIAWYDEKNHTNRKAVQGLGQCVIAESDSDIEKGIQLHNENYPEFKERLTPDYIRDISNQSKMWLIKPSSMKFWNDELYGSDESKEFSF